MNLKPGTWPHAPTHIRAQNVDSFLTSPTRPASVRNPSIKGTIIKGLAADAGRSLTCASEMPCCQVEHCRVRLPEGENGAPAIGGS